jgi:cytoskeletal protein CcmA (bactofilin family)
MNRERLVMAETKVESGCMTIGVGVRFVGSIKASDTVVVHGDVIGDVSTHHLHVGVMGSVDGLVIAKDIDVHGHLGDMTTCDHLLRVHQGGVLTGTVEYAQLEVLRGGVCDGELKRQLPK